MPNQTSAHAPLKNNNKAFDLCETINEGLRLIDSVSCLVIHSLGSADDDIVGDAMLIIGKLMNESAHANDALLEIITGEDTAKALRKKG